MSAQVESPLARRLFARPLIGALPRREPNSQLLWGPGCAAPALLGFVLRKLMPVAASFAVALTDWNIARSPQWVGLENFRRMLLHDPLCWKSLWATGVYAAVGVPIAMTCTFALALLLNAGPAYLPDPLLFAVDHADDRGQRLMALDSESGPRSSERAARPNRTSAHSLAHQRNARPSDLDPD